MKNSSFTLEHALYLMALILAVSARFLKLGRLPLSDFEAGWALQALRVTQGLRPALGPNPAYVHLTALLFYIFGGTSFLARFWPALAGSTLALVPFFFRDRLGRLPALLLAFGLALDPGLAALSRLAGGSMLAMAAAMWAWAMWRQGARAAAGALAGFALLCGTSLWLGLLGLLLTGLIGRWGRVKKQPVEQAQGQAGPAESVASPLRWETVRGPLAWGAGTLLVIGSLFLLSPKGLGAFVASLPAFLSGWWTLSDVPTRYLLISLPAYELLPLVFGLVGAVRGLLKREELSLRLSLWFLAALVLALVYFGKQVADLSWALVPLWGLAAVELGRHFDFEGRNAWELAGVILLVVVLLVFGWLDLAMLTTMDLASDAARMRVYLLLFVLLLVGLSLLMAGVGWSRDVARLGGVWAGLIVLTAYTLAMLTGATGLRQPLTAEFWQPGVRTVGADLVLKIANEISDLNRGNVHSLPLTITGMDSPALLWLFRDWDTQVVESIAPNDTPPLVITPANSQLSLTTSYRGEGFAWREAVSWVTATRADWLRWFVYHQMTVQHDQIILWVRSDLVLDQPGQNTNP